MLSSGLVQKISLRYFQRYQESHLTRRFRTLARLALKICAHLAVVSEESIGKGCPLLPRR